MKTERGFTLIEVLVSATILFMVLATGLLSYNTAMQGSQRAARLIEMASVIELTQQHIQKAIRDQLDNGVTENLDGNTTLMGVEIRWQADVVDEYAPAQRFDPDLEAEVEYLPRFFQFQVSLLMRHRGLERDYQYLEFAWLDRAHPI